MPFALRQFDVTLRNIALNHCAVRKSKSGWAFGCQFNGLPILVRYKCVSCSTINEKTQFCFLTGGTCDRAFDVSDSHMSSSLSMLLQDVHPKEAEVMAG